MPRGVVKRHDLLPYSSVVPLATATGALSSVSPPAIAQRWRSWSETTNRSPEDLRARARPRSHERLSSRELKCRVTDSSSSIEATESLDGCHMRLAASERGCRPPCAVAWDGTTNRIAAESVAIH